MSKWSFSSIIRVEIYSVDEMKELDQGFLTASHRMTEAWREMASSGQLRRYLGMGKDDIDTLKEKGSSEEGDKYIIQYLMAMQDLLEVLRV